MLTGPPRSQPPANGGRTSTTAPGASTNVRSRVAVPSTRKEHAGSTRASRSPCASASCPTSSSSVAAQRVSVSPPEAARAPAKYRTVTAGSAGTLSAGTLSAGTSAADRRHRPGRLQEARVVDAVAGQLAERGDPPAVGQLHVGGALPHRRPQVGLLAREQAVAHLAVGGQPGAVARAAERPGDRRDDADGGRPPVDQPPFGRGGTALLGVRREGMRRRQP